MSGPRENRSDDELVDEFAGMEFWAVEETLSDEDPQRLSDLMEAAQDRQPELADNLHNLLKRRFPAFSIDVGFDEISDDEVVDSVTFSADYVPMYGKDSSGKGLGHVAMQVPMSQQEMETEFFGQFRGLDGSELQAYMRQLSPSVAGRLRNLAAQHRRNDLLDALDQAALEDPDDAPWDVAENTEAFSASTTTTTSTGSDSSGVQYQPLFQTISPEVELANYLRDNFAEDLRTVKSVNDASSSLIELTIAFCAETGSLDIARRLRNVLNSRTDKASD